jgi:pyrroline-5-carboxylate reductase
MSIELGILGSGNMAEAIARGVIGSKVLSPDQILAADPSPQRRSLFSEQLGMRTTEDNREVARQARMLLLSVKPQQMKDVLGSIGPVLRPDALIISIAAGVSTQFIETNLGAGKNWRVIRTMPNTPMLVGEGMVALARGRHASEADAGEARRLFEAAAEVIDLSEDKLDAVTAMSGSGPAYFFYLVEQMIRAGNELGLAPEESRQLAIKTCVGAAKMLADSAEAPEVLRRKVTSPGGTTHAAISHLEQNQVGDRIVEALKAAAKRSRELGS